MLLHEAAHEGTRRLIADGTPATSVWTRCEVAGGAVPPEECLDERLAHPKEGGEGPWRAEPLLTGAEKLLSQVQGVGFHALKPHA